MEVMNMKNKLFTIFICLMTFVPFIASAQAQGTGKPVDVTKFDIRGITLGMQLAEVQKLIPSFQIRYKSKEDEAVAKYSGCCGGSCTGDDLIRRINCGKFTEGAFSIDFTDKPFGPGAFTIHYITDIDAEAAKQPMVFINNLKPRLQEKYGIPTSEYTARGNDFIAIWSNFSAQANTRYVNQLYRNGFIILGRPLSYVGNADSKGKFLMVTAEFFYGGNGGEVHFFLVDTEPVIIKKEMEEGKGTKEATEKAKKLQF
jgi:hypothetical protein